MIVVAGESLVDLVVQPAGDIAAHPGGGPYNAARALGRLDAPCAFLGTIGTDRFGHQLHASLGADGVDLGCVVRTSLPTTLALAELDASGTASYAFYFQGTSAPALTPDDVARVMPAAPTALHVGTLGLLLEPVGSTLEALVDALDPGVLLFLDPNCRPATVAEPVPYRARIARIARRADMVKVSADDLRFLHPDLEPRVAAARIVEGGAGVVLLTDGAATVVVATAAGSFDVAVPPVAVVDSVGAGDAFGAGVLAWWVERGLGRDALADHALLREAVEFGCRVAGLTCQRAGAVPPTRAELGL